MFKSACALFSNQSSANVIEKDLGLDRINSLSNLHLLLLGMYFLPADLMLRLLVEEVMRSVSAAEDEEGTIMDWLIMLAGAGPGELIRSPVIDCDMLGGSSPTPAMLELSPEDRKKC